MIYHFMKIALDSKLYFTKMSVVVYIVNYSLPRRVTSAIKMAVDGF